MSGLKRKKTEEEKKIETRNCFSLFFFNNKLAVHIQLQKKNQTRRQNSSIRVVQRNISADSSENDAKKEKAHSNFQEDIVKAHPYLSKFIIPSKVSNSKRFYCNLCGPKLPNFKEPFWDNLKYHLKGAGHINLCSDETGRNDALKSLNRVKKSNKSKDQQKDIEKHLRFQFTAFVLQNAFSFSFVEDLVRFCKELFLKYDVEDLQSFSLSRKTASEITKKCIGGYLKEKVFKELEQFPFSLAVDESSDIFGDAYLAITVKMLKENSIQTKLISVIELSDSKTGKALYDLVKSELFSGEEGRIRGSKCVGICTDKGSNMLSKKKGLANRLKQDFPHFYLAHDLSHKYSLIASHASKIFPTILIKMIKDISKHFGYSTQNLARLEKIQFASNVPKEKVRTMIRYTDTRWFYSVKCGRRILLLWQHLRNYFEKYKCEELLEYMSDDNHFSMQQYTTMMSCLEYYNEHFQKDNLTYADIGSKLRESYLFFARLLSNEVVNFISQSEEFNHYFSLVQNKNSINLENFRQNLIQEYPSLAKSLQDLPSQRLSTVLDQTIDFCLACLIQMKKYIPFDDLIIKKSNVLYIKHFEKTIWNNLSMQFPNVISEEEQDQFFQETRTLESQCRSGEILNSISANYLSDPLLLWTSPKIQTDYPLICKLAQSLLVYPYSSVPVERSFSDFRTIKTSKRNSLCCETLEACLLVFQEYRNDEVIIKDDMIDRYKNLWQNSQSYPSNPSEVTQSEEMEIEAEETNP